MISGKVDRTLYFILKDVMHFEKDTSDGFTSNNFKCIMNLILFRKLFKLEKFLKFLNISIDLNRLEY